MTLGQPNLCNGLGPYCFDVGGVILGDFKLLIIRALSRAVYLDCRKP